MGLHEANAFELHSVRQFILSLRTQFEDPAIMDTAQAEIHQLHQGTMPVREYSLKFCTLVVRLHGWPETMMVDYYRNGLNPDIMAKVLEQADPPTLVEWIQLAAEVESCQQLVKAIHQQQQQMTKPEGRPKLYQCPKMSSDLVCKQWMKQRKCL